MFTLPQFRERGNREFSGRISYLSDIRDGRSFRCRLIHCHIYYNSTSLDCSRKFRNFWGSSFALRRLSDRLCLENGLSIVEHPKPRSKSYLLIFGLRAVHTRTMLRMRWDVPRLLLCCVLLGVQCIIVEIAPPAWPLWSLSCFVAVAAANFRRLWNAARRVL